MRYVVGVDSGGTHTNMRLAAADGSGRVVPEIDGSLTSNRSDDELAAILTKVFTAIHGHVRASPVYIWISAAGYSAATRMRFTRLLESSANRIDGYIGICNDAASLMLGHEEELVIIIAGTGSVAMARGPSGNVITRGGDEWVVADYGSAFWIGLNGIRDAYRAVEGGPDTGLLTCLIEHYRPLSLSDDEQNRRATICEIARSLAGLGTSTKPTIASFARQVTRQAELGDDIAQTIVRQAVDDLAAAAAKVYRELAEQARPRLVTPRFLLSGSVAFNSRFYAETFRASLSQFLFDVREDFGRDIDLTIQLNGTAEAVKLAQLLADGHKPPVLDQNYTYSLFGS